MIGICMDLEKVFDRVTRTVLWWALGFVNLENKTVDGIKSMFAGATTGVKLRKGISKEF